MKYFIFLLFPTAAYAQTYYDDGGARYQQQMEQMQYEQQQQESERMYEQQQMQAQQEQMEQQIHEQQLEIDSNPYNNLHGAY